jgi:hypothetical protein
VTEWSSGVRLPTSNDTWLLVAGVGALVALFAYLAVAFAFTRQSVDVAREVAPWTPSSSKLTPVKTAKPRVFDVYVTPTSPGGATAGNYGAVVQTLVPNPVPGGRYFVGLWLKGATPGVVGFELNEFRSGVARYPVDTTVPATARWHHYTFSARIKGTFLGLAVYVYRSAHRGSWFAIRGLTAGSEGH